MIILRDLPSDEDLKRLAARYPDLDPDAARAFLSFLRAACEVFHASDNHFANHGTSCGRFTVLALLNRDPDRVLSPSRIADACGVTRATITGLLDGLEADGQIRRTRDKGDRRTQRVQLTAEGRRFLDEMMPGHYKRMGRLMAEIGAKDRDALRRIADRITSNVHDLNEPAPERPR